MSEYDEFESPPSSNKQQEISQMKQIFLNSIDPVHQKVGFTRTQEKAIDRSLQLLAISSSNFKESITTLATSDAREGIEYYGNLWYRLADLMDTTEAVSGQRVFYTPQDFFESLKPYSNSLVERLLQAEAQKQGELSNPEQFEISEDKKEELMQLADQSVNDRNFINTHIRFWLKQNSERYQNRIASGNESAAKSLLLRINQVNEILEQIREGQTNEDALHGAMRSFDFCVETSMHLFNSNKFTSRPNQLLWGEGGTDEQLASHYIVASVPDERTRDILLRNQEVLGERRNLLSLETFTDPALPAVSLVHIIDGTLLQTFDNIPFLQRTQFAERINLIRTLSPRNISNLGVFVGPYIEYIQLMQTLAESNPFFKVEKEIPEEIKHYSRS